MKSHPAGLSRLLLSVSLLVSVGSVPAQDVTLMGVAKGINHQQTGPTTVVLGPSPYKVNAFVNRSAPGSVLTASVTPPGRVTTPLADNGDGWGMDFDFSSQAALDTAFPNGNFTLNITGKSDGARSVVIQVSGDAYPSIPTLNDFSELQNVTAGMPLTLSWLPVSGGTSADFVEVRIESIGEDGGQTVFVTPEPGQPGSLNGTHTSVVVPAGILASGQTYTGELLFARIVEVDSSSYGQGVPAIGAYFRGTRFRLATAGTADTEAPQLWQHSPSSFDDQPAPRNSGVAFGFSEPMQASQSIIWTGIDPAKFTYRWTDGGRVLLCLYSAQLPASTRISWQLNRSAFRDVAGNLLPNDAQGSFTTGSADTSGMPDLAMAGLWKSENFTQVPGASPQARGEHGHAAGAFADSTAFNTLIAGTLRLPGGNEIPLKFDRGDALALETEVNTKAELDANAPAGTYQLTIETVHQGTRTATLTVPPDAYPSVPEYLSLSAAQGFDPTQPLTLSWKPMAGGTANDFIGLWIEPANGGDSVFETPEYQSGQGLTGIATSLTIPAGTMKPGRTYDVELEFVHPSTRDTATLPGSTLVVAFTRITHAQITAAGVAEPPRLRIERTPDQRWNVRVTGDTGVNYVLESANRLGDGWSPVTSFQIFGDAFEWTEGMPTEQRFFRVREGF